MGRGMGGYFQTDLPVPGQMVVTTTGELGRTHMHVGILYPLLKGGVILSVLFYGLVWRALVRPLSVWCSDRFNCAAVIILPIYILFLFIEGPASMTALFDGLMYGVLCGRGLSSYETSEADGVGRGA